MGEEGGMDTDLVDNTLIGRKKRARGEARVGDLKRVAEIVMVLSAMGEMRGGNDPTAVEKAMVAEARERLGGMCEAVKPKDLFSSDAVRVVVEDLGLNRSRDPMMVFRPPKMSIAEKVLLTKRKMEESKEFAAHSSIYSSQVHTVGFGVNSESPGTSLHGTPRFLPERTNPMTLTTGGFQSTSPAAHVPALTSANSSLKQPQFSEAQSAVTAIKSSTVPLERDSPSLAQPRREAAHLTFDGRLNGPPYLTQVRASSAAVDYLPDKTPTTSLGQSTTAPAVKLAQATDPTRVKSEGALEVNAAQASNQVMRNQDSKTSAVQATPLNLLMGKQPTQSLTLVHGPSFFTNHADIAKSVQRILQPKVSDHPNWTPPSIDYTNKPLNCQICKTTITDVESLLVCDACEKGTHLKCLQAYGNKGIPKAEWHCPKCLISSNGKPLPPKYGRVTRTIGPSKASSNIGGTHTSEKRVDSLDSKGNQQKLVVTGNSGLPDIATASSTHTNHDESAPDAKAASIGEIQGFTFPAAGMNSEEMYAGTSTNNSNERAGEVCITPITQSESSNKHVEKSGSSPCDLRRPTTESMLHSKIESEHSFSDDPHDNTVETTNHTKAPTEVQVGKETMVSTIAEVSMPDTDESKEQSELQGISEYGTNHDITLDDRDSLQATPNENPSTNESKEQTELNGTSELKASCDFRLDNHDNPQATSNGALDSGDGSRDYSKPSPLESHIVDWVGDVLQDVEEKVYYQSSRINDVLHKLQDHVLIYSDSHNFLPSRLQSLWEDKKTGTKWAIVNPYYFPDDIPEVVTRPSTPENNEVYASSNESTIMASSICGPCEVQPMEKFKEEIDRRTHLRDVNSTLHPIFMCRWMYDESGGIFQSMAH